MITPGGGLSTPAVFQAWNQGGYPMADIDNAGLADALRRRDFAAAQNISRNDLEPPAILLMPEIAEIMEAYRALGEGGQVIFTFDTHFENYMETQEGANLPVPHCIE